VNEIGLPLTELDTPALWVDLEKLERNITLLAGYFRAAGIGWRPHTKGIKIPAVAHKLLAAGAIGVTCAKLGEAEVMAAAGVGDILVANQVVGAQKITRLVNLRPHADVKVAVDDPDTVRAMGAAATAKGVTLGVVIEVNTGMNRSGVEPGQPTLALAQLIEATPGVQLRGLMTWEGHALEQSEPDAKRRAVETSIAQLTATVDLCRAHDLPIDIVSGGGSGTYQITAHLPGMTEIQAGGAIWGDMTYQKYGTATEPALLIHTTVTSRPTPQRIIIDAGFKTLPRGFVTPQPLGVAGVKSLVFSAEHGNLSLEGPNHGLQVGDTLELIVGYSDATVFLHDQLYGVRDGLVETVWPILGRGKLR
jgi:D-serine deaminase-like pyridoxal phosphate-dependent protein